MSRLPATGAVVGIDVGWSATRPSSALCRLWWDAARVGWTLARCDADRDRRRAALLEVAGAGRVAAVAIDGPLKRGLPIIDRYRAAEAILTRGVGRLIGKPGAAHAPVGRLLNHHANLWAALVRDNLTVERAQTEIAVAEICVVESFPDAFLGVLLPDPAAIPARRGKRSDVYFEAHAEAGRMVRLVATFLPGRTMPDPGTVTNHDERAALVCALAALLVAGRHACAVGDEDGFIALPGLDLMAPWAPPRLAAAAAAHASGRIVSLSPDIGPTPPSGASPAPLA